MTDEHVPGQLDFPGSEPDALYWPAEEPPGETCEPASEDRAVELAPHAPILAGTFALYQTPEGGFMLVTESERGIEYHHLPAAMVKLAKQMAGGGGGAVGGLMRRMMGG